MPKHCCNILPKSERDPSWNSWGIWRCWIGYRTFNWYCFVYTWWLYLYASYFWYNIFDIFCLYAVFFTEVSRLAYKFWRANYLKYWSIPYHSKCTVLEFISWAKFYNGLFGLISLQLLMELLGSNSGFTSPEKYGFNRELSRSLFQHWCIHLYCSMSLGHKVTKNSTEKSMDYLRRIVIIPKRAFNWSIINFWLSIR